jgi:16S rRNA (adenine1518-N6/adenine1519-N6)-dimethyltransferase
MRPELTSHRPRPIRRLGQHFLIDNDILKRIVGYASLKHDDIVLEVGPGTGTLTSLIAETAGKVIAVEKDLRFVKLLHEKFDPKDGIEVIHGDVLQSSLPNFNKVVSNIPYYISSKFMLFLAKKTFEIGVLTLQKEFAQKLVAENGYPNYGRITVAIQHRMDVKLLDQVPKESFKPRPKVESVIVTLKPKLNSHNVRDEVLFDNLVRDLFTQRRRHVKKVLGHYLESKVGTPYQDAFKEISLPNLRVCEMTVRQFEQLSDELCEALAKNNRRDQMTQLGTNALDKKEFGDSFVGCQSCSR